MSQTVTQKADRERDERSPEYKTDDEKRDDLNNDIQQTNDDGLGANNISDEEKGQKNVSVDVDKTETEANTDNNKGDPDTQFRFNITNEQKLKEDHEKTFDNYFHDTVIDDSEANDNQIPMQSSQKTDEREDKHETMKDNTVDYKSNAVDDYDKRTRKQSRNETDGEITIVTKKKVPPKEMTIMTDEEKSELKETEDSKVKASTTDATQRSEEPKKSEHRCPSPSNSSSVESEPHIVTKKKGDQREEEQKEPERWASDARKENTGHSSNKADAKSAKGGAEVTPKQAQIVDNKSTSPKRTIHQTPTRTESPRNIAAHARKQNPRMAKSAGPGGRPTFSRTSSTATSTRSPSRWSRPRTCGYREGE